MVFYSEKEQELWEIIEIKSKYSSEFLREKFKQGDPLVRFVIASNFNIYMGYCVEHYEVCLLYDLNPALVHRGDIFYKENVPLWFKEYSSIIGTARVKEIIKNKILSFLGTTP